jgi:hypothetical protein
MLGPGEPVSSDASCYSCLANGLASRSMSVTPHSVVNAMAVEEEAACVRMQAA